MLKKSMHFIVRHIRIGYVSAVLCADLLLLALVGIDCISFEKTGSSLMAAVLLVFRYTTRAELVVIIKFLVVMIFIIPICMAIIRVCAGAGPRLETMFGIRSAFVDCSHTFLSLFFAFAYLVFMRAEIVSGYVLEGSSYQFGFESIFANYGVLPMTKAMYYVIGLLGVGASIITGKLFFKTDPADWVVDYIARVKLADLRSTFYPTSGRHSGHFNTAGIAPEIRFTKEYSSAIISKYQSYLPGSSRAKDYLEGIAKECRSILSSLMILPPEKASRIEFFPGTSRALEVALSRLSPSRRMILSPYEHPTEEYVVKWCSGLWGVDYKKIDFRSEDFGMKTGQQVQKVASEIKTLMGDGKQSTLVLSEVCYSTGRRIPVEQITRELWNSVSRDSLKIVIDGAHAVGNGQWLDNLECSDCYVFSAHKWMFSPEPCGVLVSSDSVPVQTVPYDCWSDVVPQATASARTIAGLRASLELFQLAEPEYVWSRSTDLRDRFEGLIRGTFGIVGPYEKSTESFMIAVYPDTDYRWGVGFQELSAHFRRKYLDPLVLRIDPVTPWIRIAFPYFLDTFKIELLAKSLKNTVVKKS